MSFGIKKVTSTEQLANHFANDLKKLADLQFHL